MQSARDIWDKLEEEQCALAKTSLSIMKASRRKSDHCLQYLVLKAKEEMQEWDSRNYQVISDNQSSVTAFKLGKLSIKEMEERDSSCEKVGMRRSSAPSRIGPKKSFIRRGNLFRNSMGDAVHELADKAMNVFDSDEIKFPTNRRSSNIYNSNNARKYHYHAKNLQLEEEQQLELKIVSTKFELASIEAEADTMSMELRSNMEMRMHLEAQRMSVVDELSEKAENLEIEVDQLRKSYEAVLDEIKEAEEILERARHECVLCHEIFETVSNRS